MEFQDWMLGATSPEIYFEFSSFGTDPITNTYKPDITIGLENFIISKLKGLSEYGIKDLVQEYKRPGTAWYAVHSKNNKLYQTIGNDLIRQEFLWRRNHHE